MTCTLCENTTQSKGMARRVARGPRGVRGQVRSRLMAVAREQFSTREFSSVTVRGIAEEAGVDPSLVSYYFGGKSGLLRAAMSLPADPVAAALKSMTPLAGAGNRVLTVILTLWEETNANHAARVLIHQLLSSEETMYVFRTWIDDTVVTPVSEKLNGPLERTRAAAGVGVVVGVLLNRYIAGIEPIASASIEDSVEVYGPCLQYLFTPEAFRSESSIPHPPHDRPSPCNDEPPRPADQSPTQTYQRLPQVVPSSEKMTFSEESTPLQNARSRISRQSQGSQIVSHSLEMPQDPSFPQNPKLWPF